MCTFLDTLRRLVVGVLRIRQRNPSGKVAWKSIGYLELRIEILALVAVLAIYCISFFFCSLAYPKVTTLFRLLQKCTKLERILCQNFIDRAQKTLLTTDVFF